PAKRKDTKPLRQSLPPEESLLRYVIASLLRPFLYGFAVGAKNPIAKSREVRNPAGELKITGIELTATLAVAISPCDPPGITSEIFGCPVSVIVSAGSFAPTYICSSM